MATLGLSKVFILDKYFTELQKFWETEKKLQGERAQSAPRPALASRPPPRGDGIVMIITFFYATDESSTFLACGCGMRSRIRPAGAAAMAAVAALIAAVVTHLKFVR